jgi:hypothetical protein
LIAQQTHKETVDQHTAPLRRIYLYSFNGVCDHHGTNLVIGEKRLGGIEGNAVKGFQRSRDDISVQ